MIKNVRHKGLRYLRENRRERGVRSEHLHRLRTILTLLESATCPADLASPALRLHELKGRRRGTWSVRVSGNWRVTFRFDGEDVTDLDYEDYH